jgi:hypothetical protein
MLSECKGQEYLSRKCRNGLIPLWPDPVPAAAMPVWRFEPEGGSEDALLSSATLWGVDILVEALRVEDDDDPAPVPSVRYRSIASPKMRQTQRLAPRDTPGVAFAVPVWSRFSGC